MHRKFITLIVALAITVTTLSAAPVRADENVRNILAGLAALAVIGAIIKERRDDDDDVPVVSRRVAPQPYVQPRPLPPRVSGWALPRDCMRRFNTDRGKKDLLSLRCVERNYPQLRNLPRSCARQVDTGRGDRWGYAPNCLRQKGYSFARY